MAWNSIIFVLLNLISSSKSFVANGMTQKLQEFHMEFDSREDPKIKHFRYTMPLPRLSQSGDPSFQKK